MRSNVVAVAAMTSASTTLGCGKSTTRFLTFVSVVFIVTIHISYTRINIYIVYTVRNILESTLRTQLNHTTLTHAHTHTRTQVGSR